MESTAWREIVSTALSMGERFRAEGSVAWYRGERDATWKLKSTLHRYAERLTEGLAESSSEDERISHLRDEYKDLLVLEIPTRGLACSSGSRKIGLGSGIHFAALQPADQTSGLERELRMRGILRAAAKETGRRGVDLGPGPAPVEQAGLRPPRNGGAARGHVRSC